MKNFAAGLLVALMFASALPAQAGDWGDRHDRRFDRHDRHGHRGFGPPHAPPHRHGYRRHHDAPNPWAWGAAGLALGGAILAIEASRPAPVFVPPAQPPGRLWYYCEAYGAYYPQVQYCPGGWRAIQQ